MQTLHATNFIRATETYNLIDPTDRSHPILCCDRRFRNVEKLQNTATHCNTLQHTATTATHYPSSERVSRTESKTLRLQSSFHSFVSCAYVTNFIWWGYRSATVLHTIKMRLHHELHVMRMQNLYATNFIWWGCGLYMSRTSYDEDADSTCHKLDMTRTQRLSFLPSFLSLPPSSTAGLRRTPLFQTSSSHTKEWIFFKNTRACASLWRHRVGY